MAKVFASYDQVADVAYISIGEPETRARYLEDERGVVWRVSLDGKKRGATLLNFRHNWGGRDDELLALLKANLPFTHSAERRILEFA
jgi:hypothetical protein